MGIEHIFRAYDIRGRVEELTPKIAKKIGMAAGTFLNGQKICVAFDTRFSSPVLKESLAQGLMDCGCEVADIGMLPNPVAYFFAWMNKIHGVLVTGSHTPAEYNGFKFFRPNGTSYIDEYECIKKIFLSENFSLRKGSVKQVEGAIEDYRRFLAERIKIRKKLKVGIECFGGAGAIVTPGFFESFNLEVFSINDKPNGKFHGIRPEPKGENLKNLRRVVLENGCDFGVAFDGDGDRSVFIDDEGTELNGTTAGCIFIKDVLERSKGKIVMTVDCASEVKKLVEDLGGELIWSRVGHPFIEDNTYRNRALFAAEQSSHFYHNQFYPFSDGILSTLLMAKILSKENRKLSQLSREIKLHPIEKLYIDCKTHERKLKVMERLRKKFPEWEDIFDGIKTFLNDVEWIMIRTSQTMPEINLCVEALNERRLEELVKKYSQVIEEEIKEVS